MLNLIFNKVLLLKLTSYIILRARIPFVLITTLKIYLAYKKSTRNFQNRTKNSKNEKMINFIKTQNPCYG